MILVDGVWVCPKCLERNFRELREKDSYITTIKNHDITADGRFKFIYVCDNCNINIVEYDDIKRKRRL
jgi:head-tail adaptor